MSSSGTACPQHRNAGGGAAPGGPSSAATRARSSPATSSRWRPCSCRPSTSCSSSNSGPGGSTWPGARPAPPPPGSRSRPPSSVGRSRTGHSRSALPHPRPGQHVRCGLRRGGRRDRAHPLPGAQREYRGGALGPLGPAGVPGPPADPQPAPSAVYPARSATTGAGDGPCCRIAAFFGGSTPGSGSHRRHPCPPVGLPLSLARYRKWGKTSSVKRRMPSSRGKSAKRSWKWLTSVSTQCRSCSTTRGGVPIRPVPP